MNHPFSQEPPDEALLQLQREYLRDAPERLAELRKDLQAFRAGEPDALESLRTRFHRLAGSGGSYGFDRVTEISRAIEHRILTPPAPLPQDAHIFDEAISALDEAFNQADTAMGAPPSLGRIPGFGWRALVMMRPDPRRDDLVEALKVEGFVVVATDHEVDPWDVSATERPDLVVIGTDLDAEVLTLGRYWSAPSADRPRAVVMVEVEGRLDRLQTAAVGVDSVFSATALPAEVTSFARALASVGAPPAKVLVVEDDPAQATLFGSLLAKLNARVTLCNSAQNAREALVTDTPDLVLLDVDLPDVDGYAVARLMRQEPRLALVPIVFLTARRTMADEIEGLRAGGDDFLAKPVDSNHLLQIVLTRTERGRRIRELAHRDGLTGVINHATLMAELEHAAAFATRHGEPLCFLMLDLDHFKRINDTYGHLVGDQVLIHVASVFRRCIRNSDLLGRYGGEEFGIILRRCPPANGRIIAEKLRAALAANPVRLAAGEEISLRVSIGVSAFHGGGMTATEMAAAADRALYRAKSTGRDRVEMA